MWFRLPEWHCHLWAMVGLLSSHCLLPQGFFWISLVMWNIVPILHMDDHRFCSDERKYNRISIQRLFIKKSPTFSWWRFFWKMYEKLYNILMFLYSICVFTIFICFLPANCVHRACCNRIVYILSFIRFTVFHDRESLIVEFEDISRNCSTSTATNTCAIYMRFSNFLQGIQGVGVHRGVKKDKMTDKVLRIIKKCLLFARITLPFSSFLWTFSAFMITHSEFS